MKNKLVLKFLLIIFWLVLIYWFSNQPGEVSLKQSNEIIYKVVDIVSKMNIEEKEEIAKKFTFITRKVAHIFEYMVLSFLISIIFYQLNTKKYILISSGFCLLIAIFDEIHQSFVVLREACVRDVIIDLCGSLVIIAIFSIIKIKKQKKYN